METIGRFFEKLVDIMLSQGGFGGVLLFLGLCVFVFLYVRERSRNVELTNVILASSEKHADKFVEVVTSGIETDTKLASTISQLTDTIADIKHKLDRIVHTQET